MARKNQVPDRYSYGSDRGPSYDPQEHELRRDSGREYTISGVTFGREEDDFLEAHPRSRMADTAHDDIELGFQTREQAEFGGSFGARSFSGVGPKGYRRSDENIKEEASHALYKNKYVDASNIEVSVQDGCIFLSGHVDGRTAKRLAEECVADIRGVEDVQNQLKIVPGDEEHFRPNLSRNVERDEELRRQKLA